MTFWELFWPAPNWIGANDGIPIEVTHHVEGNILTGYKWVPNDAPDHSKDYRPYDGPLF